MAKIDLRNLLRRAGQSLSAIALWPLKAAKRVGVGGFKKLQSTGSRILRVAKKACVSSFKKLKPVGQWIWKVLKKIGNHIKIWYGKRKPKKMGAGAKVALAVTTFSAIGLTAIVLSIGGLSDVLGIVQVMFWLLITLVAIFVPIGIGYGIWTKKSFRGLTWVAVVLVLLMTMGCVWWFWGSLPNLRPSFKSMMSAAIPFVIVAGAILALTYLFAGDTATKVRRGIWSTIVLYIAVTLLLLYADWGNVATDRSAVAQAPAQTICPDVSAQETRTCLISTEWSNWIRLADGARDNGKKICHSLGIESEREDSNGATLIRFRTTKGEVVVKYRLYPLDTSCSLVGF